MPALAKCLGFSILGRVFGKPLNADGPSSPAALRVRLARIVDGTAIDLSHGRRNLILLEGIA